MTNHGGKREGAGRPKGAQNKNSLSALQQLNDLGCDPIANLAHIAMGGSVRAMVGLNKDVGDIIVEDVPPTLDQQMTANIKLLPYIHPALKAIEHSGNINVHEMMLDELE